VKDFMRILALLAVAGWLGGCGGGGDTAAAASPPVADAAPAGAGACELDSSSWGESVWL
jgi:hypothetical protein